MGAAIAPPQRQDQRDRRNLSGKAAIDSAISGAMKPVPFRQGTSAKNGQVPMVDFTQTTKAGNLAQFSSTTLRCRIRSETLRRACAGRA
jgi:hypothetical protein